MLNWQSNVPTVSKLGAHILQIGIPHIVYRKDKQVIIFLETFSDIGVQTAGLLLVVLLDGLGLVDDARTLGTRHFGLLEEIQEN